MADGTTTRCRDTARCREGRHEPGVRRGEHQITPSYQADGSASDAPPHTCDHRGVDRSQDVEGNHEVSKKAMAEDASACRLLARRFRSPPKLKCLPFSRIAMARTSASCAHASAALRNSVANTPSNGFPPTGLVQADASDARRNAEFDRAGLQLGSPVWTEMRAD